MKKIKVLMAFLMAVTLLPSLTACGSNKGEEVYEKFEDDGYYIIASIKGYEGFYDDKGTKFAITGEKEDDQRVVKSESSILSGKLYEEYKNASIIYISSKEDKPSIIVCVNSEDDFIVSYVYSNYEGDAEEYYRYNWTNDLKNEYGYNGSGNEYCEYIAKGSASENMNECTGESKEQIKKFIKDSKAKLKDDGPSMEDINEFVKWYYNEKIASVKEQIKDKAKKQSKLTTDEIIDRFADDDLTVKYDSKNDVIRISNEKFDNYDYSTDLGVDSNPGYMAEFENGKLSFIYYEDYALAKDYSSIYRIKDNEFIAGKMGEDIPDDACLYYLNSEKIGKGTKCSDSDINEIKEFANSYYSVLNWDVGISNEEFIEFLNDYYAEYGS